MWPHKLKYRDTTINFRAVYGEFVAMTLFVFAGCSAASVFSLQSDQEYVTNPLTGETVAIDTASLRTQLLSITKLMKTTGSWGITVALTFGFSIVVLIYATAHVGSGQINCCVTWALFLSGQLGPVQAVANVAGQLVGSLLGAGFVYGMVPQSSQWPLGANAVSPAFTDAEALLGESMMTFLLCLVVLLTATDQRSIAKNIAPLAIGLAVFLGHAVLIPIDGCSINPTRSFGPAAVSGTWANFWVFVVGPFIGSTFAVLFYYPFCCETGPAKVSVEWEHNDRLPSVDNSSGHKAAIDAAVKANELDV